MGNITISGASGALGRRVAEFVLDRVPAERVVLVTRNPDRLADLAARGADVRRGDFDDPASLDAAFAGAERLLLISASEVGARLAQHRTAVDAAARAGVRHVVYTSILRPRADSPLVLSREHHATEEMVRASGLASTFLRNSIYADLQPQAAEQALASGAYVTNAGDGRLPYVAREDCAAAAAAVLTTDGHEGRAYDITGPDRLSPADLAALFADVGGRPVELVPVDDEAYAAGLAEAGLPAPVVEMLTAMGAVTRAGELDSDAGAVERLTGRAPRSLRSILEAAR